MGEPQILSSMVVHQWYCDHFGHLNARHYAAAFDDALFIFWGQLGAVIPERGGAGTVPVTAEMKTTFRSEARAGMIVTIRSRVLRVGGKSVTLMLEMTDMLSGRLLAACEVVEVFFDTQERASRAIPDSMRGRLEAVVDDAAA